MATPSSSDSPARNLTFTLHDMTKSAIKAQADLAQALADALSTIQGMPKPALDAIQKYQEMRLKLQKQQEAMTDAWFDVAKKFDPTGVMGAKVGAAAAAPVKMAQDLAQKAVKTQVQIVKTFAGFVGGAVGKAVGAAKKATGRS